MRTNDGSSQHCFSKYTDGGPLSLYILLSHNTQIQTRSIRFCSSMYGCMEHAWTWRACSRIPTFSYIEHHDIRLIRARSWNSMLSVTCRASFYFQATRDMAL